MTFRARRGRRPPGPRSIGRALALAGALLALAVDGAAAATDFHAYGLSVGPSASALVPGRGFIGSVPVASFGLVAVGADAVSFVATSPSGVPSGAGAVALETGTEAAAADEIASVDGRGVDLLVVDRAGGR